MSPIPLGREDIAVFNPLAGLSHHFSYSVAPTGIMGCLFMSSIVFRRAVNLYQDKPGRVFDLLDDVKASNPGFLDAVASVLNRSCSKRVNILWFHMGVNDYDIHANSS
jgi:hypothetical protein